MENLQNYEPTRFMGVTRIFEKIEEGIRNQEAELSGIKKSVFNWAQRQALHHHLQEQYGQPHSSLGYTLAKKMILSKVIEIYKFVKKILLQLNFKIHNKLGFKHAVENGFVIGGSAVSPETVRYLLSLDMKMLETTSMTEQGGLVQVCNTMEPGEFRIGRVGREFTDQCEVKLINKDEVGEDSNK